MRHRKIGSRPVAERISKGRYSKARSARNAQDSVAPKRYVDVCQVDILALALACPTQLERVDLHEHLLVTLLLLGHLHQLRTLVQVALRSLLNLGL